MITPQDCLKKYGEPTPDFERKFMVIYEPDADIHEAIKPLPARIYVNKDIIGPLHYALVDIFNNNLCDEFTEWGGCFNIRKQRGAEVPSIHSWGIAIDINVSTNKLGETPTMLPELVKCFTDNGFDWGGVWQRKDGMHFQLKELP